MATVNLGRIKPVFRGAYNSSTAYVVDDIVTDSNETFICILASTGNATSNATYWTKLAAKGTDGTDVGTTLTTQGDILYRDGSGLQRLGAGTSGQFLKTQGTGANPVWGDVAGVFSQYKIRQNNTQYTNTNSSTDVTATNHYVDITPTATSKNIMVKFYVPVKMISGGPDCGFKYTITRTIGGTTTDIYVASNTQFYYYDNTGTTNVRLKLHFLYLDSPNTTSSCRYSFKFRNPHSTSQVYVNNDSIDYTQIEAFETDESYQ